MSELPLPVPHTSSPLDTARNLREAFAGIAPGAYRSADLLPRYNAWAKSNSHPDITPKTLGEWIKKAWNPERSWAHGHVAVFHLTADHLGEA
jgi:hypothetical protein